MNPTYYEPALFGGGGVNLYSTAAVSTVESGQTIISFTVEYHNDSSIYIDSFAGEYVYIDGTAIELTDTNTGVTATNGLNYASGRFIGNSIRIIFDNGTMSEADFQTLVNGITYENQNSNPSTEDREVIITTLVDSGSEEGANDNLNDTLSITSAITVIPLPVISNVSVDRTDTTATINWTTNTLTSSDVGYAPTGSSLFASTGVLDTAPRVTNHAIPLTGLSSCSQYTFTLQSIDAFANDANTPYATFITTGCDGTVNNFDSSLNEIQNGSPASFEFGTEGDRIIITPSTNYSTTCDAVFQAVDLAEEEVIGKTGPSITQNDPARSYSLGALCEPAPYNRLTSFDNPITITIEYPNSAITGLEESSLNIYRWSGTEWQKLNNCILDMGRNSITCETTEFSTFTLFGSNTIVTNSTSGGSAPSNDIVQVCENGKCVSTYPTRQDENYQIYQNCKSSGKHGSDCAIAWAESKNYIIQGSPQHLAQTQESESFYASAPEPAEEIRIFKDLESSHPAFEAILWMAQEDIIAGYPDETVRPDSSINRVEFLKIILNAANKNSDRLCQKLFNYSDVDWNSWYGNFIQKASCEVIVEGYPDGTFRPSDTINFVEGAKVAVMALGLETPQIDGPWFAPYLEVLKNYNAIPSSISANDQVLTRGEMAQIVWKLATQ